MKITVFGSTGGTGRVLLTEAARRGHEITAFARQASALDGVAGLAEIVQGDARDPDHVAPAIEGRDAVIVTVAGRGQAGVATAIAQTVTAAMLDTNVRRLIATSAYGMVATRPYVMAPLVRLLFGKAFADQRAADEVIAASALDWTIVRATRLVASAAPGAGPRLSTEQFAKGPWSLSRAAYAAELLDLAQAGLYVRETVNTTG
jgi:putative NADH-flavin reductase